REKRRVLQYPQRHHVAVRGDHLRRIEPHAAARIGAGGGERAELYVVAADVRQREELLVDLRARLERADRLFDHFALLVEQRDVRAAASDDRFGDETIAADPLGQLEARRQQVRMLG